MHRDSHLIFESYIKEGWRDIAPSIPFTLAMFTVGLGGVYTHRTTQDLNRVVSQQEVLQKMLEVTADYKRAILNDEPIDEAAKDFFNKNDDLYTTSKAAVKRVMDDLNTFKINNPDKWERIKTFDDAYYKYKDEKVKAKEEDAEKVATEPYLNTANDEEILTQYKQAWRGAGGGYGKGYMQQT